MNRKSYQSSRVECKEFKKNTLVWWDLAIFITAFRDVMSLTVDVHEAISAHQDGGWG